MTLQQTSCRIAAAVATPLAPHRIEEDLFLARMRRGSMHRKLMGFQAFSVASMRIAFPGLYTVEVSTATYTALTSRGVVNKRLRRKVSSWLRFSEWKRGQCRGYRTEAFISNWKGDLLKLIILQVERFNGQKCVGR